MRATLHALLVLFCAHAFSAQAAAAQTTSDFNWPPSVIHHVDLPGSSSGAGSSASFGAGSTASYPPESTIAVELHPHVDDLITAARSAQLHVVGRVDPASVSAEAAVKALKAGLVGFIAEGDGGDVEAFKEKVALLIQPGMSLRIAPSAALVEPQRDIIRPGMDWEAFYAGANRGAITRIQVDAWSPELVQMLLLVPGGVYIQGALGPIGSTIAAFRVRHPALGAGTHEQLVNSAYTFRRSIEGVDEAVVVVGAAGRVAINVSRVFADDTLLQDAVTGTTAFVSFGMATFEADKSGLILIEEMP